MLNEKVIRDDFPILKRKISGKRIVYLDSTATSLKPKKVIDAVNSYYLYHTANVFRGIYTISEEATAAYEYGRDAVARLIHAQREEIVFTRNTTEALNLCAYCWLPGRVGKGDAIATTILEHHSNFVPWQQYAHQSGCDFTIWYIHPDRAVDLNEIEKIVTKKTKLLALSAVSNVLGTILPVAQIVRIAKRINPDIFILVDAAQAVPHMEVDVTQWGADAIAFSGHKMLGPSGIGVLWAKKEVLESIKPFLYGGDMIREVHEQETVFNDIPHKFEAGTPFIEGAMGIGAAADYLMGLGMDAIREHEKMITAYALEKLKHISGLTVYGPSDCDIRGGVISFSISGMHPHDIAQILNDDNVCIRVGYHCAMPLHEYMEIGPTARASFYVYSGKDDVDSLVSSLIHVKKILG